MPFTSRVDKTQKEFKYKRGAGFVLDKSVISLKTTTVANSMIGNVLTDRHVRVLSILGGGCKPMLRMLGGKS